MEASVGFGIIGTGNIAQFHAACIEKISNAELLGVLSKSQSRALQMAPKFNAPVFWKKKLFLKIKKLM